MSEKEKICITTDCVCDLPDEMLKDNNIDLVYFYIETDTGRFRDRSEITAQNIFEYLKNGGKKSVTGPPSTEEFIEFFTKKLKKCDEVIHIATGSKISTAVAGLKDAVEKMGSLGERVHIFDSGHLSTGIGHLVLRAAEMVRNGEKDSGKILDELEGMRDRVSTTFMADSADYLYSNGKVSKAVQVICSIFNIHPVLEMKNGYLGLKSIQIGNYEKSALRYIRKELKAHKIKTDRLFITHAGCTANDIKLIRKEVNRVMKFDSVIVTKASATVSGNSGPRTFGVLFVKDE
ncbi:MAG: DegV family EDD domain-containing protein [Oscillospiraceae bacterium]|nr:DegV family EDD domain-containing protein [Oscillospiraceae bacterium]